MLFSKQTKNRVNIEKVEQILPSGAHVSGARVSMPEAKSKKRKDRPKNTDRDVGSHKKEVVSLFKELNTFAKNKYKSIWEGDKSVTYHVMPNKKVFIPGLEGNKTPSFTQILSKNSPTISAEQFVDDYVGYLTIKMENNFDFVGMIMSFEGSDKECRLLPVPYLENRSFRNAICSNKRLLKGGDPIEAFKKHIIDILECSEDELIQKSSGMWDNVFIADMLSMTNMQYERADGEIILLDSRLAAKVLKRNVEQSDVTPPSNKKAKKRKSTSKGSKSSTSGKRKKEKDTPSKSKEQMLDEYARALLCFRYSKDYEGQTEGKKTKSTLMGLLKGKSCRKLFSDRTFRDFDNVAITAGLLVPPSNQKGGRKPLIRPKPYRTLLQESVVKNITKSSNRTILIEKPGRPHVPPKNGTVIQRAFRVVKETFGCNKKQKKSNVFGFENLHQSDKTKVYSLIKGDISEKKPTKKTTKGEKPTKKTTKAEKPTKKKAKVEKTTKKKAKVEKTTKKTTKGKEKEAPPPMLRQENKKIPIKLTDSLNMNSYSNDGCFFADPTYSGKLGESIVLLHIAMRGYDKWQLIKKDMKSAIMSHLYEKDWDLERIPFVVCNDKKDMIGGENRKKMYSGAIKYMEQHCSKKEFPAAKKLTAAIIFFMTDGKIESPKFSEGTEEYAQHFTAFALKDSQVIKGLETEVLDSPFTIQDLKNVYKLCRSSSVPVTDVIEPSGDKQEEEEEDDVDMFDMLDEDDDKKPTKKVKKPQQMGKVAWRNNNGLEYFTWRYEDIDQYVTHQKLLRLVQLDKMELDKHSPKNVETMQKIIRNSKLEDLKSIGKIYKKDSICCAWSPHVLDLFVFMIEMLFMPGQAVLCPSVEKVDNMLAFKGSNKSC